MGENKNIKELDAFAKKYVREIKQEEPSLDFTSSLMGQIAEVKIESLHKENPLISKKAWFSIAAIIIAIISFSIKTSGNESVFAVNFSFMDQFQLSTIFESLNVSMTTVYAFVFFGLMIFIQFAYLKNHFQKRFN